MIKSITISATVAAVFGITTASMGALMFGTAAVPFMIGFLSLGLSNS
jgi:hypothetical protein